MIERQVLRVLYSPVRAFEEIAKTPNFKGPLLIFALTMLATAGLQYVGASKTFLRTDGETVCLLTRGEFSKLITDSLINTLINFFLNWTLYAGILFLTVKMYREETGRWVVFYVIIGYVFSVTVIQVLSSALLVLTLPALGFPLKAYMDALRLSPATDEEVRVAREIIQPIYQENWYSTSAGQALFYLNFPFLNIIDVWTAALCAIAIRSSRELTWTKAVAVSAFASIIRLFLRNFLGL